MKRRAFITALGGAAAWPVMARAQQPAMPIVGVLNSTTLEGFRDYFAAFGGGLADSGFVEGMSPSSTERLRIVTIGCRSW
jgi:putative tryptophan/tyrosine transport system substrate-binding protein